MSFKVGDRVFIRFSDKLVEGKIVEIDELFSKDYYVLIPGGLWGMGMKVICKENDLSTNALDNLARRFA